MSYLLVLEAKSKFVRNTSQEIETRFVCLVCSWVRGSPPPLEGKVTQNMFLRHCASPSPPMRPLDLIGTNGVFSLACTDNKVRKEKQRKKTTKSEATFVSCFCFCSWQQRRVPFSSSRQRRRKEEKRINPFLYHIVVLFTVLFIKESFPLLHCYTYRLECQTGETGMSALQIYLAVRGTYIPLISRWQN